MVAGDAPLARIRSIDDAGTDRRASDTFTSVGKKVTIPAMTVTASRPRPKMRQISGVMATSGTERSAMAIGMNADSTLRHRLNTTAKTTAATVPATSPMAASRNVVIVASRRISRWALLAGSVR